MEQPSGTVERAGTSQPAAPHARYRVTRRPPENTPLQLPELTRVRTDRSFQPADVTSRLTGVPRNGKVVAGSRHAFWFDAGEQTQGMAVQASPLDRNSELFTVETAYVDHGEKPTMGAPGKNQVWGLSVNSQLLSGRLRLHSEYAMSRQIRGTETSLLKPRHGKAYSVRASYAGRPVGLAGKPVRWSLTVGREQAGPSFWALESPGIVRDRAVERLSADASWGSMSASLGYSDSTNDVNGDPRIAEHRWTTVNADLRYADQELDWLPAIGELLGSADYALRISRESTIPEEAPADVPDRHRDTTALHARFEPGRWWWEVNHRRSRSYADQAPKPELHKEQTGLRLSLPLGEHARIAPAVRWDVARHDAAGGTQTNILAGSLEGVMPLVPGRVDTRLRLEGSRRYRSDGSEDFRTVGVSGSMNWHLRRQRTSSPQVTFSLRASYQASEDVVSGWEPADRYQGMAEVRVSWPPAP